MILNFPSQCCSSLNNWTVNETQQNRILRLFRFSESVSAGMGVVGAELVMLLLCDLFDRNDRIPMSSLQKSSCPGTLKGFMSVQGLCETLEGEASFVYPHTFCRAREMVAQAGHDVKLVLECGIRGHKLWFFPALKFYSVANNKKVSWNFKDLWEIHDTLEKPSVEARAVSLVGDVCLEMEQRGLSFIRNTQKYMKHGMPWMEEVLLRLPKSLKDKELVKVMTFVSSIALIQNGDFISFEKLGGLLEELPVTQARLRSLQVLSRFLLPRVYSLKLWALHETIPHRLRITAASDPPKTCVADKTVTEPVEEEVVDLDCSTEVQNVKKLVPRFLTASCSLKWSNMELALIEVNGEVAHKEAYEKYMTECQSMSVPVRSYNAFCSGLGVGYFYRFSGSWVS